MFSKVVLLSFPSFVSQDSSLLLCPKLQKCFFFPFALMAQSDIQISFFSPLQIYYAKPYFDFCVSCFFSFFLQIKNALHFINFISTHIVFYVLNICCYFLFLFVLHICFITGTSAWLSEGCCKTAVKSCQKVPFPLNVILLWRGRCQSRSAEGGADFKSENIYVIFIQVRHYTITKHSPISSVVVMPSPMQCILNCERSLFVSCDVCNFWNYVAVISPHASVRQRSAPLIQPLQGWQTDVSL